LVGAVGAGAEQCLVGGLHDYIVIGDGLSPAQSMRQAEELIADAAGRVVKDYITSI
jgi:hypothetical protein